VFLVDCILLFVLLKSLRLCSSYFQEWSRSMTLLPGTTEPKLFWCHFYFCYSIIYLVILPHIWLFFNIFSNRLDSCEFPWNKPISYCRSISIFAEQQASSIVLISCQHFVLLWPMELCIWIWWCPFWHQACHYWPLLLFNIQWYSLYGQSFQSHLKRI